MRHPDPEDMPDFIKDALKSAKVDPNDVLELSYYWSIYHPIPKLQVKLVHITQHIDIAIVAPGTLTDALGPDQHEV
jgi:hypothetical protein